MAAIREFTNLKSQIVTSSWGGIRQAMPYAFMENSTDMLSSMLNNTRTIQTNREFSRLALVSYHGHVCTLELNRFRYFQLRDHKLSTAFRYARGSSAAMRKHRAIDDTRIVAAIWLVIEER